MFPRLEQCKYCLYEVGHVDEQVIDGIPQCEYVWDCDMGVNMFEVEYCDEFMERV